MKPTVKHDGGWVGVGALLGGHYRGLLRGWGYSRYYVCAMSNNSVVNRG